MKKEKLTAYDNFIISKQKTMPKLENDHYIAKETMESGAPQFSPKYTQYIKGQLRRTEPSAEKVLTKEEFELSEGDNRKAEMWEALQGKSSSEARAENRSIQFKKFGKILLCGYVIIMLALALIVIVKTTAKSNGEIADATATEREDDEKIELMPCEESEENDNWFDKICDSLK